MHDFEKLGVFYLGRRYELARGAATDELVLYDSKDLTTHAVCVGMTGSGKTGLCLALLEEAAIDGIPALAIDPKGDLGNLLLTFPELRPADFRPWIDESAAARANQTPDEFAEHTAQTWRDGLASWGEDGERIARLRDAVDMAIYTPGSTAGLPITVLRSFAAPPEQVRTDADALRERIESATSGLLALLGIDADPVQSRPHIFIANLLDRAWREGRDLDLAGLIRQIQSPPLERIGVMDLETFFPERERTNLAMTLNNLLASPTFSAWLEGEPLDVKRLLYTPEGKPRVAIISIAHLSEAERMFLVTILLNEVLAWMRGQPGTSSLRALLYMDEVFGYFPPTANPPSKKPMLTLLKQARAYGLGVVLATQNPVDLDYKGLSNTGTWFLGRLQTERDKMRVLEGLEGASVQAGSRFDRQQMEATLAGLGSRRFLMNNVHEDEPVVFETRWVMSYLRGPLTRGQIAQLMAERKQQLAEESDKDASATEATKSSEAAESADSYSSEAAAVPSNSPPAVAAVATSAALASGPPEVPAEIGQMYAAVRRDEADTVGGANESGQTSAEETSGVGQLTYRPVLLGKAHVHFVRLTYEVDCWRDYTLVTESVDGTSHQVWDDARMWDSKKELADSPASGVAFTALPEAMSVARNYASWSKSLQDHLYRTESLTVWKCPELKEYSQAGEAEDDFRIRLAVLIQEQRDEELERIRKRYEPKLTTAQEQIRRAEERIQREEAQYEKQKEESFVSVGSSLLGALLGRKLFSRTNVNRAKSSLRTVRRVSREREDIEDAKDRRAEAAAKLAELEKQLNEELAGVKERLRAENLVLEPLAVRARKGDLDVQLVAVLWLPWLIGADGAACPQY